MHMATKYQHISWTNIQDLYVVPRYTLFGHHSCHGGMKIIWHENLIASKLGGKGYKNRKFTPLLDKETRVQMLVLNHFPSQNDNAKPTPVQDLEDMSRLWSTN